MKRLGWTVVMPRKVMGEMNIDKLVMVVFYLEEFIMLN